MRETTYFGNYRGIVVNNYDPELAGKIQVRVLPVFQSIDDAVLPWAIPAMPISSGAGYGTGTLAIPIVGSFVWVFFEEGDIYQPVYFAEAQNLAYGIPAQTQAGYPNTRVISFPSGIQLIVDAQIFFSQGVQREFLFPWIKPENRQQLLKGNIHAVISAHAQGSSVFI